jgi:hypothetical protein
MLAQCYGYSTKDWAVATASLRFIYPEARPVWMLINLVARSQLDFGGLAADAAEFLDAVLGEATAETE